MVRLPVGNPGDADYDPRRYPRRGVRIQPLPRALHPIFLRFCEAVQAYISSQLSTWRHARSFAPDDVLVEANMIYWLSAQKFMRHVAYLGTTNDPRKRRKPHQDIPESDPEHGGGSNRTGEGPDRVPGSPPE